MTAPSSRFEIAVFVFQGGGPPTALETRLERRRRDAYRTPAGKPAVHGAGAFSFSDSGGVRAYLVANRKYVALDVESRWRADLAQRRVRLEPLLQRNDRVATDFLATWVAKEACAKALGIGLLRALPRLALLSVDELSALCVPCGPIDIHAPQRTLRLSCLGHRFAVRCTELPDVTLGVAWRLDYGEPRLTLSLACSQDDLVHTVAA
jgi:4'-phosphopantetheinyl transferase